DKLALAALEATLALYADPARAALEVPALAMLKASLEDLETRARRLAAALAAAMPDLLLRLERGGGEVGGGALPLSQSLGWVVEVRPPRLGPQELQDRARGADPPVLGILRAGTLRLDPRALADAEIQECAAALRGVWSGI